MKTYKVYDYYNEYIFGKNQLIDYVTDNLNLEFVEENLKDLDEVEEKSKIMKIINKVYSDVEITLKEALQVLKYADYEIEEVEIY